MIRSDDSGLNSEEQREDRVFSLVPVNRGGLVALVEGPARISPWCGGQPRDSVASLQRVRCLPESSEVWCGPRAAPCSRVSRAAYVSVECVAGNELQTMVVTLLSVCPSLLMSKNQNSATCLTEVP